MGMDTGSKTIEYYKKIISEAKTIIWNGSLWVFEFKITKIEQTKKGAFTLIGGGDSATAVKLGFKEDFTWISTGGRALLGFMEGKELPGIASIQDK
ncbi:phosphoglycerate kinase [Mycoplasma cottewii]|nr:phosphoglycerate kinase [Mycoplasma cottewii]